MDKSRFIEALAALLVPWGMPAAAARVYGYLLMSRDPASLDRIAVELGMAKSSVSVAARLLETYTLVSRRRERGSKRALYEVSDNYEKMLAAQNRLLEAIAEQLLKGVDAADSEPVSARLKEMSDFYLLARRELEGVLQKWRAQRQETEPPRI